MSASTLPRTEGEAPVRVEKNEFETEVDISALGENVEEKVLRGSSAYAEAMLSSPPKPFTRIAIHLYMIAFVALLAGAMGGIDESIMGSLLVMTPFQETFGTQVNGSKAGIITALFQIGSVISLPFIGESLDRFGRRFGLFIGSLFVVLGSALQGTSARTDGLTQFYVGRILIGFGSTIALSAGPTYVVEIAHPAYRGVLTALQSGTQNFGGLLGAITTRFTLHFNDNMSWLIPVWLQIIPSSIIVLSVWFLPESPRWLYTHGSTEKAFDFLTKFHGEGDRNNPFVRLQIAEFESDLDLNGSDKRWWDYRGLIRTRADRYRLMNNLVFTAWGALSSGGIGYYIGAFYESAGITNQTTILNYNLGNCVQGSISSIIGSYLCDFAGRRTVLLTTLAGICLSWLGCTVASAVVSNNRSNSAAGKAGIAFFLLFNIVYCVGMTPLQGIYATEVLSYEQRAKGTAVSNFVGNVLGLVTQFGTPVALEKIGWKTYVIWTIWNGVEFGISYIIHVETKGYTLEELDQVFASSNPRRESTRKRHVLVTNDMVITEAKFAEDEGC
jgi:sugar porter (SP) family MFS transporter